MRSSVGAKMYFPAVKVAFEAPRRWWEIDQQLMAASAGPAATSPRSGIRHTDSMASKGVLVGAYIWSHRSGAALYRDDAGRAPRGRDQRWRSDFIPAMRSLSDRPRRLPGQKFPIRWAPGSSGRPFREPGNRNIRPCSPATDRFTSPRARELRHRLAGRRRTVGSLHGVSDRGACCDNEQVMRPLPRRSCRMGSNSEMLAMKMRKTLLDEPWPSARACCSPFSRHRAEQAAPLSAGSRLSRSWRVPIAVPPIARNDQRRKPEQMLVFIGTPSRHHGPRRCRRRLHDRRIAAR